MVTAGRKIKKIDDPSLVLRTVDNTRGSNLWSYNHFRSKILTSLLNDLIDLENHGLDDTVCNQVQRALEYFVNASTNIPQGGFLSGGPLYKEIENFNKIYIEWNGISGREHSHILERRKKLRELRQKRQNISNKIRRIQYEIENNLDQKVLHDSYNAIGVMINMVPSIFVNLSSSYKDY